MKKVLLAVDETGGSKSVLSVFEHMVREPESVVLVHVRTFKGTSMINMPADAELKTLRESTKGAEGHRGAQNETSEKIMSFYKKELEARSSVNVKALVRAGIPSEVILKVAQEEKVDLIIMGSSGKSVLRRLVSGCAAREVERAATVPVLVATTADGRKKSIKYGRRETYAA